MSQRSQLAAVVGTVFLVGCSHNSSPTSPSPSVLPSVSSVSAETTQAEAAGSPVLVQLDLANNFLVSANQQLTLFFVPPNPVIPPNPILPLEQNTLAFYLKANGVLEAIPPNPILPSTDALSGIIGQANITLDLINTHPPDPTIPPNPIIPQIVTQAQRTITLATSLQNCGDVCSTP
jgi:hypothetical protein